jgi:N-acetylglutamate synthase/N-acetylornithine aminotransferase
MRRNMSLETVHAVWQELSRHLSPNDKAESAEALVSILVDHDYEANEIAEEFVNDVLVKEALGFYLDEEEEEEEELEDYDDEEEEY